MLRVATSFFVAMVFTTLFFLVLKAAIEVRQSARISDENLRVIDFVRLKKEQQLTKKERVKPKKPKTKKQPPKPKVKIPKPQQPKVVSQPEKPLNLDLPLDLSASSALGDALVSGYGERAINGNVIPLVRIDPIYPKRAKMMKKEGYVKMEFTITEFGGVKDVTVVESEPDTLFNSAATRALMKWRFKPKIEDNQALEQRAMVQMNFKLDR
jgi:protein TonB